MGQAGRRWDRRIALLIVLTGAAAGCGTFGTAEDVADARSPTGAAGSRLPPPGSPRDAVEAVRAAETRRLAAVREARGAAAVVLRSAGTSPRSSGV